MRGVRLPRLSQNGPDAIDCEVLMRAIEGLHGGQVQLTVTPVGISSTGGLGLVLSYQPPAQLGGVSAEPVLYTTTYPSAHYAEFFACVFNGLYALDSAIGRRYVQETFPKA